MSQTPRTDAALKANVQAGNFAGGPSAMTKRFIDMSRELERENTTLRNYLMTLASEGAKPGDAKTLWRKVRGGMI